MPDIQAFTSWAAAAGKDTRLAAIRPGPDGEGSVVNLSAVKNPLARLVGTRDAGARRDAAVGAFKLALTAKYGGTIALLAFERGSRANPSLRGLSARQVTAAVEMAERLVVQHEALKEGGFLGTRQMADGGKPIPKEVIHDRILGTLPREDHEFMSKLLVATAEAHELLGTVPGGKSELKSLEKACERVSLKFECLGNSIRDGSFDPGKGAELREMLASLRIRLDRHLEESSLFVWNAPGGEQALEELAMTWRDAMRAAARMRCANRSEEELKPEEWKRAGNALAEIDLLDDSFFIKALKAKKTEVYEVLAKKLNDIFASHGVGKKILPGSGRAELKAAFGNILNRRDWAPINKSFDASVGGQPVKLTSTIVPGRYIEQSLADGETVEGKVVGGYEDGVNAYHSGSSGTANAVTLATSKITVTGARGETKVAFSGVRHAVNSAWGLKDAARTTANFSRAVQCVHAALVSYLERHPDADPKTEVKLQMTSVSLLTPDAFRHSPVMKNGVGDERQMMTDQYQAWQALNNLKEPLELKVGNRTYRVKPDILMFNYGVNYCATFKLSGMEALAGWKAANRINFENWPKLLARVTQFEIENPNHPNRDAVRKLLAQLSRILEKGDAGRANHDSYKVGARLSVLSYLIGGVPCWNCKSGKDRTGQMDVECKFLAALIANGQDVPEPGARLSAAQKELYRAIALKGGNFELQKYNTGIGGNKVHDVASVQERLGGGTETIKAFKGGSSHVSAK